MYSRSSLQIPHDCTVFRCASISSSDDCDSGKSSGKKSCFLLDIVQKWQILALSAPAPCAYFQKLDLGRYKFLDALASLVLMIDPDREIGNWQSYITSVLILEIETPASHRNWNVTQNGMSLKMEGHSKWKVTQYRMSLKMECHLKFNATKNWISLKMECHL